MSRSPIDALVDKACGVPEGVVFTDWLKSEGKTIELECPTCGTKKTVAREKSDPKRAVKVLLLCPKCWPPGAKSGELGFYDKDGNVVPPGEAQG